MIECVHVARRLLAADRPLGRLYLAGLHVMPAHVLAHLRTQGADYWRTRRIADLTAELAAIEAEQRAHGFGTGAVELAAAEAAVEPAPVERWPNTGHGAPLAGLCEMPQRYSHGGTDAAWYELRAEYRDDRRWTGAYVEAWFTMGDAHAKVSRALDGPTAHDDAVAFVGRWGTGQIFPCVVKSENQR